jgi:hypothetical protein
MPLSPPAPLADRHVLDDFCCGVDTLDIWLKRRARANQISGATRNVVVADSDNVMPRPALAHNARDRNRRHYSPARLRTPRRIIDPSRNTNRP